MNLAPAWKKGYTGKGVVVSILDDGIQTNHPDLAQNYVSTYNRNKKRAKKGEKARKFYMTAIGTSERKQKNEQFSKRLYSFQI